MTLHHLIVAAEKQITLSSLFVIKKKSKKSSVRNNISRYKTKKLQRITLLIKFFDGLYFSLYFFISIALCILFYIAEKMHL